MAAATNRQVQIRQAVDAAISAAQVREKRPYIPDERAMNRSQKSPKCTVNSLYRMVNRDPRKVMRESYTRIKSGVLLSSALHGCCGARRRLPPYINLKQP